jgi:hypothetical protein
VKILISSLVLGILFLFKVGGLQAENLAAPTPTLSAASLEEERKRLELERLELENEKLRFELERMKLRSASPAPVPTPPPEKKGNRKEDVKVFQSDLSEQCGALSKERKDDLSLLVPDFVNSEIWSQGVRYSLHELYAMAPDRGWDLAERIHSRAVNGYPRTLYTSGTSPY